MENAEAIAERQDKANHMQFGHVDETFNDIDAKYEAIYQEFKKVWIDNPSISKKEAFKEMGRTYNPDGFLAKHVNKRLVEDGLPLTHKKEINFQVVESSSKDEFESLYQQFKEMWIANPTISKKEIFKKLGRNQTPSLIRDVAERMVEDGLPEHYEHHGRRKQSHKPPIKNLVEKSEYENKYQEYKNLFETTDIPLKDIREQLSISDNTNNPLRKYIIDRCKEDGLDGRKRNINQQRKKNPRVEKAKTNKSKKNKVPKKSKKGTPSVYSQTAHQMVEDSRSTLEKLYKDRNISKSTQKGYEATFIKWCEFTKDRFNNLQEMLDFYFDEEDKRIPMRDRTLKKDLLDFREHLLNDCESIKSDRSFKTYFAKLKTIFNHFELEMPKLPQMKMEKGYISNYNDLPTHAMIKTACEQSPLDLKAVMLFMSSSGTAKAETLSITIGMFLEGCNDYLETPASANNINPTIKELSDKHDIIPMIYLRRIKTDKWYYTYCSPEASYMIIESLKTRRNLKWDDKLFDYTSSLLLTKFQEINDNNEWGFVGSYRRFRSHALRKFMASNIGLPRDITDSIQGRSKDMIQEAYFKQDPQSLKKTYSEVMHRIMIYENWGHGTTPAEIEQRAKRVKNGFNDNEKILDLSVIPETPDEIKSSIGLETDHETLVSTDKKSRTPNKSNSMPITPPVQVPVGTVQGISISKELLQYAELMDRGLLSIGEFNRIKQTLLMSVIR